jgi:integrase
VFRSEIATGDCTRATRPPHLVPLAAQAVRLLRDLQPLTGHGRDLFPSLITGERPMSDNTGNVAFAAWAMTARR